MTNFGEKVNFIWSVADLLRGPYKPAQYGRVILPLTVLRRLDCVLEPTKEKVLARSEELKSGKVANVEPLLNRTAGASFHNTSRLDFKKLKGEPDKIAANLTAYIKAFSSKVRDIFDRFNFEPEIAKLDEHNRLFLVVSKFADIDLHPGRVSNIEMGYVFEELIRRFNEAANETAGDHFTPREVIRLMVNLLFAPDRDLLVKKGVVRTLFDPACGTGGMLAVADEYLHELNPDAKLEVFGQDHNPESYAVCGSDMLIKGHNIEHIVFGSSFTKDGFSAERFDYLLANPPFGVEWKPEQAAIEKEHEERGFEGRFGAGLPRINDGSLLFLQHMISKMKAVKDGGSRLGIVLNSSPLFSGDAASGESEIRRWIIENDWLEAIVALPEDLFYNTGIFTHVWIVTNRKPPERRGKVQLVNAVHFFRKLRKSLNKKRNEVAEEHIAEITRIYGNFQGRETRRLQVGGEEAHLVVSTVFDNAEFGFRQITVERPLRLNFQAAPERIERLKEATAFQNLAKSKKKDKGQVAAEESAGRRQQEQILGVLAGMNAAQLYKDRATFVMELEEAFDAADVKLAAPIRKAILAALSERDEAAEICRDLEGRPEPDPELRDYENVPLSEDVTDHFNREVLPHVPDAWINESVRDAKDGGVGRVGYEIAFTQRFYRPAASAPLEKMEEEIARSEHSIVQILQDAAAKHALVINRLATQGVGADKPKQATPIDWLPTIPAHWELKRLKYVANLQTGLTLGKKYEPGETLVTRPYLRVANVQDGYLELSSITTVEIPTRDVRRYELRPGDVLMTEGGDFDKLGRGYVWEGQIDGCLHQNHIFAVRPHSKVLDSHFLATLLSSLHGRHYFTKTSQQTTNLASTNSTKLLNFPVPLPPKAEQLEIMRAIRQECEQLEQAIVQARSVYEKMREYRASLISAAVTGQIDVRNYRGGAQWP